MMKQKKKWAVLALTVLLLGAGGLFLYRSGFFAACTSIPALRAYIDRSAPYSHLTFFVVQLLSVVLAPIPSNLTAAAGGLLFGTWPAFFLTYGAVMAGSLLVFWLARTLGRDFVDRVVSRKLAEKYQKVIREKTTVFLALAFLLPYFPDDMLCILAGLTPITFGRFALLALFTRPWGLLFASALGGASLSIPLWAMVLIGLAGVMIFVLGMLYGDRLERAVLKRLGKE
ncbi:MAG: VTT domain-containing protein [Lawsonibacter sp.]